MAISVVTCLSLRHVDAREVHLVEYRAQDSQHGRVPRNRSRVVDGFQREFSVQSRIHIARLAQEDSEWLVSNATLVL
jgi:hypothetical protein